MSRHSRSEPFDANYLIVTVTADSYSRYDTSPAGWPRLVIEYGGAALVLDADDLRDAETYGIELARSSLAFAWHCRHLLESTAHTRTPPSETPDDQTDHNPTH